MVSTAVVEDFLAQQRLAFVGVSHDPKEFSATSTGSSRCMATTCIR